MNAILLYARGTSKRSRKEEKKTKYTHTHNHNNKNWILNLYNVSGMHHIRSMRLLFNVCASYSPMFQLSLHNRLQYLLFLLLLPLNNYYRFYSEWIIIKKIGNSFDRLLRCNNEHHPYWIVSTVHRHNDSLQHLAFETIVSLGDYVISTFSQ